MGMPGMGMPGMGMPGMGGDPCAGGAGGSAPEPRPCNPGEQPSCVSGDSKKEAEKKDDKKDDKKEDKKDDEKKDEKKDDAKKEEKKEEKKLNQLESSGYSQWGQPMSPFGADSIDQ